MLKQGYEILWNVMAALITIFIVVAVTGTILGMAIGAVTGGWEDDKPNCYQDGPYDMQCEPSGGNGDEGWGYR